jgi:hypothetical protein
VAAVVLALAAVPAKAAIYCVHQPGTSCRLGTINKGVNLQDALTAASASSVGMVSLSAPGSTRARSPTPAARR